MHITKQKDNNPDQDAYQDFLKDCGLSKRQIRQLQEFEETLRDLNDDYYEEDETY